MPATRVTPESVGTKDNGLLSPAYISNGHVFTAGQIGIDNATGQIPELVEEQTELAIANLKTVLEAAGSSLDKVFKVLLFVADPLYGPKVNEVYKKYFPQQPARSCVVVGFPLSTLKVELEVVALVE